MKAHKHMNTHLSIIHLTRVIAITLTTVNNEQNQDWIKSRQRIVQQFCIIHKKDS